MSLWKHGAADAGAVVEAVIVVVVVVVVVKVHVNLASTNVAETGILKQVSLVIVTADAGPTAPQSLFEEKKKPVAVFPLIVS